MKIKLSLLGHIYFTTTIFFFMIVSPAWKIIRIIRFPFHSLSSITVLVDNGCPEIMGGEGKKLPHISQH